MVSTVDQRLPVADRPSDHRVSDSSARTRHASRNWTILDVNKRHEPDRKGHLHQPRRRRSGARRRVRFGASPTCAPRSAAAIRCTSRARRRAGAAPIESRSPTDARVVVARVATATEADVRDAVAAARAAFPRWSARPGRSARRSSTAPPTSCASARFELAAWLILEMGKNRVEALGEIEETADLIRLLHRADARERRLRPRRWDGWCPPTRTPACCGPTACGR